MSFTDFTRRPHSSYGGTGSLVVAILAVGGVAWYLIWGPGPTVREEDVPPTTIETTVPEEKAEAKMITSPFSETKNFERTNAVSTNTAILTIQTTEDGQYQIKECITGEIVSKGVWTFDADSSKVTLTHVGTFPMSNVFLVESQNDNNLTLTFILSESTNLQYELLSDGDTFTQRAYPNQGKA